MRKTTTVMLAIASLLTVSATAMAATSHRSHRMDSRAAVTQFDARAQGPSLRYDPSTYAFEPAYDSGQTLFDRAKGGIE